MRGQAGHAIREAPVLYLWGSEAAQVQALPGAKHDLGMGLTEAIVHLQRQASGPGQLRICLHFVYMRCFWMHGRRPGWAGRWLLAA
jgi:hypothetical protein